MPEKYRVFQFLRFCAVGLTNTAVDFASFYLLTLGGIPYLMAQVLSYSAGVANSFFGNRKWTFKVKGRANVPEAARFIMVNGLSLLTSSALLFVLQNVYSSDLWLSKLAATGCGFIVNFMGSRLWVFTKELKTGGEIG